MKCKLCPYKKFCHSSGDCENCDFGKAFEKLNKKLKNTKAENKKLKAEVERLKNTHIELPCNVGDTVYVPWRWGGQRAVATVKIEEIKFYDSQMHYMFLIDMESDNECFNQSFGGWKLGKSIGETVFLIKEEAEKALAERKDV